jgi:hypothetical protein
MRWSDERILTTHTGSLPRPPELTRLYVRRARGEAIDRAELDRVGKAALRRIVGVREIERYETHERSTPSNGEPCSRAIVSSTWWSTGKAMSRPLPKTSWRTPDKFVIT